MFSFGKFPPHFRQAATIADFVVTAQDQKGEIMAIRHKEFDLYGVQFHPESIMTPQGYQMLENFFTHVQAKMTPAL